MSVNIAMMLSDIITPLHYACHITPLHITLDAIIPILLLPCLMLIR